MYEDTILMTNFVKEIKALIKREDYNHLYRKSTWSSMHKAGEVWSIIDGNDPLIIRLVHDVDFIKNKTFKAAILKGKQTYKPKKPNLFVTSMCRLEKILTEDRVFSFNLNTSTKSKQRFNIVSWYTKKKRAGEI
jgi:hypothetical protein